MDNILSIKQTKEAHTQRKQLFYLSNWCNTVYEFDYSKDNITELLKYKYEFKLNN